MTRNGERGHPGRVEGVKTSSSGDIETNRLIFKVKSCHGTDMGVGGY